MFCTMPFSINVNQKAKYPAICWGGLCGLESFLKSLQKLQNVCQISGAVTYRNCLMHLCRIKKREAFWIRFSHTHTVFCRSIPKCIVQTIINYGEISFHAFGTKPLINRIVHA